MNGKVDDIVGIAKPFFMMAFDETFAKSAQSELGAFIAEYDMATKSRWCILSDYCLGDPKKKNDVIVFSLLPQVYCFGNFYLLMDQCLPKDLKETECPTEPSVNFLKALPAFHITFILPKGFTFSDKSSNEHSTMVKILDAYTRMLQKWIKNASIETGQSYTQRKKELEKFLKRLKQRNEASWKSSAGKHIVAMRNALTVINLFAAIVLRLLRYSPNAKFCWFSDRDAIMEWPNPKKKHLFAEIAADYIHVQCVNSGQKYSSEQFCVAVPEAKGKIWYDVLNRVPDHIAGILSQLDLETGDINQRLTTLRDNVIANNDNLIIIPFLSWNQAARTIVSKIDGYNQR